MKWQSAFAGCRYGEQIRTDCLLDSDPHFCDATVSLSVVVTSPNWIWRGTASPACAFAGITMLIW